MNTVTGILKAFMKVIRHKIIVFKIGKPLGVSLRRRVMHDMSKLSIVEFSYYVKTFELGLETDGKGWEHHWKNNDHHIEYWEATSRFMPDDAIREMVADWHAASIVYNGVVPTKENWKWGKDNLKSIFKRLGTTKNPCNCPGYFLFGLLLKQGLVEEKDYLELYAESD